MNIEEQHKQITIRFAIVAALAVALIIPTVLIDVLVSDRWTFYRQAVYEIKNTWSADQVLIGPTIIIPVADDEGDERRFQRVAFMPKNLDLHVDASHQFRSRNIFTTPVLEFSVSAEGSFAAIDLDELMERHEHVFIEHAVVSFAVSDVRGFQDGRMLVNNQTVNLSPMDTGFGKSLNGSATEAMLRDGGNFDFTATLRASGSIRVVPHADQSLIRITSSWPHPKFDGDTLPTSRVVTESGFEASWTGNLINRGFNQKLYLPGTGITYQGEMVGGWRSPDQPPDYIPASGFYMTGSSDHSIRRQDPFGENLPQVGFTVYDPVTPYRKVSRTVKYGILFVILTFGAILCMELVTPVQFHYVQYLVIGTALVIFFLTLLSISEHTGFGLAYFIAATIMTLMLSAYSHFSSRNRLITAAMISLLLLLYGVLYLILQLENYALLVGTGLLLLLLGVLMWATRSLTLNRSESPS